MAIATAGIVSLAVSLPPDGFFSGGTMSDSGDMVSQQAVKDTLKQIVEAEPKENPYSDDQLVEELSKRGVHIARRTVTKYRKALGIDSSSRRKQF